MKRELSPSYIGIGPVNKKSMAVSLPRTGVPLIADVKLEDFVAENVRGSDSEPRSAARNAYEQFQISMKSVCMELDVRVKGCSRL